MGQLTVDERRRVFAARAQGLPKPPAPPPGPSVGPGAGKTAGDRVRRLRDLATIAVIVTVLAGGSLAWRTVEFHRPQSLLDAVLPRG